jgi:hypothetical protein
MILDFINNFTTDPPKSRNRLMILDFINNFTTGLRETLYKKQK